MAFVLVERMPNSYSFFFFFANFYLPKGFVLFVQVDKALWAADDILIYLAYEPEVLLVRSIAILKSRKIIND